MYGKLFRQMYKGTLATVGPWQALVTFQQFIILADSEGIVDMTPEAISRETTIPLDVIRLGITALEMPDPDSRTPDEEGRRIVLLADHRKWGWRIVNYEHYRLLKREEDRREYHRQYWHKRKDKLKSLNDTQHTQPIAEAEAKEEAKAKNTHAPRVAAARLVVSIPDLVAEGVQEQHAADWIKARGKVPLTSTAWEAIKREASKAGLSPMQAVQMAAENSWRGFKADWVQTKRIGKANAIGLVNYDAVQQYKARHG